MNIIRQNLEIFFIEKKLVSILKKLETENSGGDSSSVNKSVRKMENQKTYHQHENSSLVTLNATRIWNDLKSYHAQINDQKSLEYVNKIYGFLQTFSVSVSFSSLYIAGLIDHDCNEQLRNKLLGLIVMFTASEIIEITRENFASGQGQGQLKIKGIEHYLLRLKEEDVHDYQFHKVLYSEVLRQISEGKYPWQVNKTFEDSEGFWKSSVTRAFQNVYGTANAPDDLHVKQMKTDDTDIHKVSTRMTGAGGCGNYAHLGVFPTGNPDHRDSLNYDTNPAGGALPFHARRYRAPSPARGRTDHGRAFDPRKRHIFDDQDSSEHFDVAELISRDKRTSDDELLVHQLFDVDDSYYNINTYKNNLRRVISKFLETHKDYRINYDFVNRSMQETDSTESLSEKRVFFEVIAEFIVKDIYQRIELYSNAHPSASNGSAVHSIEPFVRECSILEHRDFSILEVLNSQIKEQHVNSRTRDIALSAFNRVFGNVLNGSEESELAQFLQAFMGEEDPDTLQSNIEMTIREGVKKAEEIKYTLRFQVLINKATSTDDPAENEQYKNIVKDECIKALAHAIISKCELFYKAYPDFYLDDIDAMIRDNLRGGVIKKYELLDAIKNDSLFPESQFEVELGDMEIFQDV
jgi:hypothetical protein